MCWVVALGTFSSDCRSTVPPRPTTTLCRRRGLGAAVIRHGGFAGPHPHPQTFGRVSSCWRRLGSQSYPIHPPTLSDTQDSITNYNVHSTMVHTKWQRAVTRPFPSGCPSSVRPYSPPEPKSTMSKPMRCTARHCNARQIHRPGEQGGWRMATTMRMLALTLMRRKNRRKGTMYSATLPGPFSPPFAPCPAASQHSTYCQI